MVVREPQNICQEPISEETRAAFSSADAPAWCLQALQDPNLCPIATPNRHPKPSTEDSFVAETLATATTIGAWQSFYRALQLSPSPSLSDTPISNNDNAAVAGELVNLLALGRGINGHPNIAHGGLIASILDEAMGMVVSLYGSPGMSGYTAFINVQFKKPVPTPGVVLCRTWLESRSSGRKRWVRGTVEDGKGGLFAEADGLWIEVDKRVQKL